VNYDLRELFKGGLLNWRGVANRVGQAGPYLARAHYGSYFTLSVLAAVLMGGSWVALTRRQPASLLYAIVGWLVGGAVGFLLSQFMELPLLWGVLAMPVLAFLGGYLVPLFTAPHLPEAEANIVRGTRIVPFMGDTRKAVANAVRK
ncbi:ABC transporter permease, partial [Escherichia coli]|nr:ABC transporter permease [Escherichia coli]